MIENFLEIKMTYMSVFRKGYSTNDRSIIDLSSIYLTQTHSSHTRADQFVL
jgi:hypothetical protein